MPLYHEVLKALPGYPFLPCPICTRVEGCDHSVPERARATHPALVFLLDAQHPSSAGGE